MLKFRHLHYFLVLAEELHFGRAAERLAISQPPLSWNIRQLEDAVGAELFDRSKRAIRLTSAGAALVPLARALIDQADDAVQRVRDTARGLRGALRIGIVGSAVYQGVPELLTDFETASPGVRCRTVELNSSDQVKAVATGQLDLGFVHTTKLPRTLARLLYATQPFACCVPQTHPAAHAPAVAVADLHDQPFVMFARDASPDYYERVLVVCTDAGFTPDIRHEARHWLSVVALVARGLGVALVPEGLRHAGVPGARFVPLRGTSVQSKTYCVWRRADDGPALRGLLQRIRVQCQAADGARPPIPG